MTTDAGVVLACVDFSPVSDDVLACAAALSEALGAELVALHVAAPDPDLVGWEAGPQSVRNQVAEQLREQHRELQARVAALSVARARPLMVQGATAESILDHAGRLGARFVVLGSHGHGKLYELLAGSVAAQVLRKASVPIVVVPPKERG